MSLCIGPFRDENEYRGAVLAVELIISMVAHETNLWTALPVCPVQKKGRFWTLPLIPLREEGKEYWRFFRWSNHWYLWSREEILFKLLWPAAKWQVRLPWINCLRLALTICIVVLYFPVTNWVLKQKDKETFHLMITIVTCSRVSFITTQCTIWEVTKI